MGSWVGPRAYLEGYEGEEDLLPLPVIKPRSSSLQLADSRNIVNRWKNYYSQLLNVHRVRDVRQI
jgi:hypothetical protein